jgi:hypothetical protein
MVQRSTVVQYLCMPALVAFGAFTFALRQEPFGIEMVLSMGASRIFLLRSPVLGMGSRRVSR